MAGSVRKTVWVLARGGPFWMAAGAGLIMIAILSLWLLGGRSGGTAAVWSGLRDGTVYIEREDAAAAIVTLRWRPAWIAAHQPETIYVFGPKGESVARLPITARETRGVRRIVLDEGSGTYRLVIPGYSFRRYSVGVSPSVKTAFEPVKGHMGFEARSGQRLFFRGGQAPFSLLLAGHDGGAEATVSWGSRRVELVDDDTGAYTDHAAAAFDATGEAAIGEVRFTKSSKVGLWLDGTANLFYPSAEDIFEPVWATGSAALSLAPAVGHPLPRIGSYFEFFKPSAAQLALASQTAPRFSNFYIPEDALMGRLRRDLPFLSSYAGIGVEEFVSILNDTRRDSVTGDETASLSFLTSYLADHAEAGQAIPYVAFVDEPNLRYQSYAEFERYFAKMAAAVRLGGTAKIAAPESSRLVGGPTSRGQAAQTGFDWTRRLLRAHWDDIDLVTFHMWLIRDLEATDRYREEIDALAQLIADRAAQKGEAPKPLALTQTNISSGDTLSPYEQDTFFAALWWSSVLCQAGNARGLYAINWFKSIDEGVYKKGFMRDGPDGPELKPVGLIMARIHPWLFREVIASKSSSAEIDLLATRNEAGDIRLLMVNKSRRAYDIALPVLPRVTWEDARVITGEMDLVTDPAARESLRIDRRTGTFTVFSVPPLSVILMEGAAH